MTPLLLFAKGADGDFPAGNEPAPPPDETPRPGQPVNVTCPHCNLAGQVRIATVVELYVYLRCDVCAHVWSRYRAGAA